MSDQALTITKGGEEETVTAYKGSGVESWLAAALVSPFLSVFGGLILGGITGGVLIITLVVMLVLLGVGIYKAEQWPEMEGMESEVHRRLHATENGVPHLVLTDHDPDTGRARLRLVSADVSYVRPDVRVTTFRLLKTVIFDPIAGEQEIQAMAGKLAQEAESLELESHVQRTLEQEAQRPAVPEVEDVINLAVARAALPASSRES